MKIPLLLEQIDLPGLSMEVFIPDPEYIHAAWKEGAIGFPYWSRIWPAALSMSQYLMDHPEIIEGRDVLELGAGLGLPSLIAALNARSVISSDLSADAVEVIRKSAAHLNFQNLESVPLNWKSIPENSNPQVLLLSDVNYDPEDFQSLENMLQQFLDKGTTIILSTPQRLIGRDFLAPFMMYCRDSVEMFEDGTRTSVFVLRRT